MDNCFYNYSNNSVLKICPSCVFTGDIWGENGISIFVVTAYWICPPPVLRMKERLLLALCFTKDQHTGDIIRQKTLEGLHNKWKIGDSPEDVPQRVHGCTPDEGSNMLKGWDVFEGEKTLFNIFLVSFGSIM